MKCAKVKDNVNFYFRGDLPSHTIILINKHLESCSECKNYYLLFEKTENLINDIKSQTLSTEAPFWISEKIIYKIFSKKQNSKQIIFGSFSIQKTFVFLTFMILLVTLGLSFIAIENIKIKQNQVTPLSKPVEELLVSEMAETYYTNFLLANNNTYEK